MNALFVTLRETLSWKKLACFLFIVMLVLMSLVAYQSFQLRRSKSISKGYFDRIQNLEESEAEARSRLQSSAFINNTPNISSIDIGVARNGWMAYSDESHKIRFDYPADYVSVKNVNQGDGWNLTLVSKRTKDFDGRNISLMRFSNKLNPATYGDLNTPDEIVSGKYEIQGQKYDVWKYGMGEGHACGGGSIHTEAIKLREDLYVYLETVALQKNVDKNCQGDEYSEIRTPDFELDLVRRILKSVQFEQS